MKERYITMKTRLLRPEERQFATQENTLPYVIEPRDSQYSTVAHLQAFLAEHSTEIKEEIAAFGAVLLRGFPVHTTKEFEETILSIKGMTGMSDLFMSEPGRVRVDDLNFVYHTNNKIKTGGTLHLGGFHNENYYSTDVPSYISFCCFNPAQMGGETGLINMGRVYENLDTELKARLENQTYFVAKWPVAVIANRYQVTPDDVKYACTQFGLSVEDDKFVSMYKPSVLQHPMTGKYIIQANLCAELPHLNDEILKHFISNYRGAKWMLHKAAWRVLGYQRLRQLSLMLPELTRHPIRFFKTRKQIRQRINQYNNSLYPRIKTAFAPNDITTLAKSMHEAYASFLWEKGDVLIIDNLQVAHAGMPGKTSKTHPRKIRAMLCNPLKLSLNDTAAGIQSPTPLAQQTLGEIMASIGK